MKGTKEWRFEAFIQFNLAVSKREILIDVFNEFNSEQARKKKFKKQIMGLKNLEFNLTKFFGSISGSYDSEKAIDEEIFQTLMDLGNWKLSAFRKMDFGLTEFNLYTDEFNGPEIFYDFLLPLLSHMGANSIFGCVYSRLMNSYDFVKVDEEDHTIANIYTTGDNAEIDRIIKNSDNKIPFDILYDLYLQGKITVKDW